jgi:hypothetical protein
MPIEPGLSVDIAPISFMCTKMGVLELLLGEATSFRSLYDDLCAPIYQWIGRREADYGELPPLDSPGCDFRILAWYGIQSLRGPECPACGSVPFRPGLRREASPGYKLADIDGIELEGGAMPQLQLPLQED